MNTTRPERPLIHVVDDDEAMRDSLRWLLTSAGYEVRGYASGEQFLREHEAGADVCVVLDVQLPGMSGLDVQQALGGGGGEPAIVFISGRVPPPAVHGGNPCERCDFLEKPFDDEALLAAIERARTRLAWPAKTVRDAA